MNTHAPLIRAARAVRRRAYAPYSKFAVGAALQAASGKVYTGVNIENASAGLTICAERAALASALSAGERKFVAIAIVAAHDRLTPCGACRQVLAEFGELVVICRDARPGGATVVHQLSALLPETFRL